MKKPSKTRIKSKMGRPPGGGDLDGDLIHTRVSKEISAALARIRDRRMDKPNRSTMVREALVAYIEQQEKAA